MKILNRNYEHRNLVAFIILSQAYLQTIHCLSLGISIFSTSSFELFFTNHYLIFITGLVSLVCVVLGKNFSKNILLIFLCLVTAKNFILLASSFNKMILILNFIYLLFAFYFYMSWDVEVSKACFNPKFSLWDLEKSNRFLIEGKILDSHQNHLEDIKISNIDETSCFVILSQKESAKHLLTNKEYILVSNLEGVEFSSRGKLISNYDRGLGFDFQGIKQNTQVNWSELYKVCLERGLFN